MNSCPFGRACEKIQRGTSRDEENASILAGKRGEKDKVLEEKKKINFAVEISLSTPDKGHT